MRLLWSSGSVADSAISMIGNDRRSACTNLSRIGMTIRKKIFLLAGILLALFGVVVGVLAIIQKLDSDQIGNIVGYELPLSRLVAGFDVDTDRYELNILRVLRLDPASPEQLQAVASAKQALADELRSDVATAGTL